MILAAFIFSAATFAQTSGVTLTAEDYAKLSPEAKSQITAIQVEKEITGKIETTGKWVGLGKEIGTAMNESLTAITTTASNFAETKLGKFTMFIVAWKVIGTDVLQLLIGIVWIILILCISLYIYRNNTERTVLISKKWNSEGKGFEKEYKRIDEDTDYKNTAIAILCIGLALAMLIIFV